MSKHSFLRLNQMIIYTMNKSEADSSTAVNHDINGHQLYLVSRWDPSLSEQIDRFVFSGRAQNNPISSAGGIKVYDK